MSSAALLGNELGVQQVAHPGGDAWPVLDRGGHEDGSCHGGAGAAEAAMGAVFGDLQGAWLGHIEDLSTDGRAVTVGVRQRCAAARTGGGVMIHNMVRALGPRQRRSLVARLAAAWRGGLAALASAPRSARDAGSRSPAERGIHERRGQAQQPLAPW